MKKIVLLGFQTDANLGDPLISECTEYLVRRALSELAAEDTEILQTDMRGFNYPEYIEKEELAAKKSEETRFFFHRVKRRLVRTFAPRKYQACKDRFKAGVAERKLQREEKRIRYRRKKSAKNAAAVLSDSTAALIIVGGGFIKYGHRQRLAEMMAPYIDRANKLNIPVMFNSVGVEGYAAGSEECMELCRILNLPCVKTVTTRDDLETLEKCYVSGSHVVTARTPDPALWTNEVYPGERMSRGIIGLGMARGGLYRDHGGQKGAKELLELWSGIIAELERRGYEWRLFSNGLQADWNFGRRLLEHIGRESEEALLMPNPKTVSELTGMIRSFDCVAASRLHAGIIAYSYGVPVVEIVWNVKQRLFAEWAGCSDRFFDEDTVTAVEFADAIERAVSSPAPTGTIDRENTYRYILSFLRKNL